MRKPEVARIGRGEERRPAAPRPRRFVFGIAVEQILDDLVFIASGEQLRRLAMRVHLEGAHDLEGEGRH